MTVNARWHLAHAMPRSASDRERLRWHLQHQKHCGCRPMPAKVARLAKGESAVRAAGKGATETKGNVSIVKQKPAACARGAQMAVRKLVMPPGTVQRRCGWAEGGDPLYARYHDEEWGRPSRDDGHLFEMLILEGAQAGLSWITILRKRENYRRAFDGFDAKKMAAYDARRVQKLLQDEGIVRNRLKVEAAVVNARAFLATQKEFGTFARFLWDFVGDRPLVNRPRALSDVPARTEISDAMSKALQKRGFKFVGSTICYAFMQATGLVDDHVAGCFLAAR
jgi:DNA-3-methyladenine glycosylase I